MALMLSSLSAQAYMAAPMAMPTVQRANVNMAFIDTLEGTGEETGGEIWDPLDIAGTVGDEALMWFRASELKHGRVAMLAIVGWAWTATGTHFEGLISTSKGISFADCAAAGNPLLAAAKVPGAGIWQMIFAIGALEVFWESKYPSYECAGNFGVPAVTSDPAKLKELQDTCSPIISQLYQAGGMGGDDEDDEDDDMPDMDDL